MPRTKPLRAANTVVMIALSAITAGWMATLGWATFRLAHHAMALALR